MTMHHLEHSRYATPAVLFLDASQRPTELTSSSPKKTLGPKLNMKDALSVRLFFLLPQTTTFI
jgi:hypothetical protein